MTPNWLPPLRRVESYPAVPRSANSFPAANFVTHSLCGRAAISCSGSCIIGLDRTFLRELAGPPSARRGHPMTHASRVQPVGIVGVRLFFDGVLVDLLHLL